MHPTIDLVAQIAEASLLWIPDPSPTARISDAALHRVWRATKAFLQYGIALLDAHPTHPGAIGSNEESPAWREIVQPGLREVFTTEALLRVWGAILTAREQSQQEPNQLLTPVVRQILSAQLQLRQRTLTWMLESLDQMGEALHELDALRRRIERWTDVLLGPLMARYAVAEFAFDSQRAREFAGDAPSGSGQDATGWHLLRLGLEVAFPVPADSQPAARAIRELTSAIADMFPRPVPQPTLRPANLETVAEPPGAEILRLFRHQDVRISAQPAGPPLRSALPTAGLFARLRRLRKT